MSLLVDSAFILEYIYDRLRGAIVDSAQNGGLNIKNTNTIYLLNVECSCFEHSYKSLSHPISSYLVGPSSIDVKRVFILKGLVSSRIFLEARYNRRSKITLKTIDLRVKRIRS